MAPLLDDVTIRPYRSTDERSWLECRLLSFFGTSYFDDVHTEKERFELPAVELVAVDDGGRVAALLDVEIVGALATIDCIAVHPARQRRGLADRLFDRALAMLPDAVREVDAYTREDPPANAWYVSRGFRLVSAYLHVYRDADEPADGFATPAGLSLPVKAFLHAPSSMEQELRATFRRVYECRRYVRSR